MTADLLALFLRDLDRLQAEVLVFESEDDLWNKKKGISNTAGNLALHITGNLQHFIGHVLGKSDYQRNREAEFNSKVARSILLSEIENAKSSVSSTLKKLSTEDLYTVLRPFFMTKSSTSNLFPTGTKISFTPSPLGVKACGM